MKLDEILPSGGYSKVIPISSFDEIDGGINRISGLVGRKNKQTRTKVSLKYLIR